MLPFYTLRKHQKISVFQVFSEGGGGGGGKKWEHLLEIELKLCYKYPSACSRHLEQIKETLNW